MNNKEYKDIIIEGRKRIDKILSSPELDPLRLEEMMEDFKNFVKEKTKELAK